MKELGDPNETLEERLERRRRENPELYQLATDDEDDFLDVTSNVEL